MSRTPARNALTGASMYLTTSGNLAGTLGVFAGAIYGTLTFDLGDALRNFWIHAFTALAVLLMMQEYLNQKHLRTLRGIGKGRLPPTPQNLQRAIHETASSADAQFWASIRNWFIGCAYVGFALRFSNDVPWTLTARVCTFGLMFGPITSMMVYLACVLRARKVVKTCAELGLTHHQVREAMPAYQFKMRSRLIAFTAISVLTPSILSADLSYTLATRGYAKIATIEDPAARAQAAKQVTRNALLAVAGIGGFVLAIALYSARLMGRGLSDPLRTIAEEAQRVARGELRKPKVNPAEAELGAVSLAFTALSAQLEDVIGQLRGAGRQLTNTTENLISTSNVFQSSSSHQAASLTQTSATTEELARSAAQIAHTSASVAALAQQTVNAAQTGEADAEEFSHSMARMRHDHRSIADVVQKLSKRVQRIGRIVDFINSVADKSDLLALNGELEGTKAGDVGRSFSLVAAEMRRLAENVLESTREIEELIGEIRMATQAAVKTTAVGLEATETGAQLAETVRASLKDIAALAAQTFDSVRTISLATQQQRTGTDQLALTMVDILRVTEESRGATDKLLLANHQLASVAKGLDGELQRFRVEE